MGTSMRAWFPQLAYLLPSVVLQVLGILLYPMSFVPTDHPVGVFVLVLSCSMLFSLLSSSAWLSRNTIVREILLFVRILIVFAAVIPLGEDRWPAFLLVVSVLIEIAVLHRIFWGILLSSLVILTDLLLMGEHRVWDLLLPEVDLDTRLAMLAGYLIFGYLAHRGTYDRQLISRLRQERLRLSETVERLSEAGEGFLSLASRAEQESAERERQRLTREIHDTAGYTLTNIRMMMEAGLRNKEITREELDKLFSWTLEQALGGLQDIRSILRMIRGNGESLPRGVKALVQVGSVFQYATGIQVTFEWGNINDRWLIGDLDQLVLRIVQEGLTNAFRHGMATKVSITLFQDESHLWLGIHDNGYGASNIDLGIGLKGMSERLLAIGGKLEIAKKVPGFQLYITIPFQNRDQQESLE